MTKPILFCLLSTTFVQADVESQPLHARSVGKGMFTRLDPKETGLTYANRIVGPKTHELRRLYATAMCVGGVAAGDVDGDGRPDLYFANGPDKNALYRQVADFRFEDITAKAGVDGGEAWGVGASMVDIDNDGDLDIYVCNYGAPNQLYLNDGKGAFTEKAKDWGLDIVDASHTPAFCDYDLDGHLDLYLLTNKFYPKQGKFSPKEQMITLEPGDGVPYIQLKPEVAPYVHITDIIPDPKGGPPTVKWIDCARPDRLLRNNGKGKFEDVTIAAKIDVPRERHTIDKFIRAPYKPPGQEYDAWGLSATWWDYNDDGYPDLWVGNDFDSPDCLYRNNGDGTFTNEFAKDAWRASQIVPHTTWFSMGADFGDLNRDGRFDFFIADMSGSNHYKQKTTMGAMGAKAEFLASAEPRQYMRNALFLGTGENRFLEAAYAAGLSDTDWTWTIKICDLDNDGWEDVFVTNGMSRNYNESDKKEALDVTVGETQWDRHIRAGTAELRERNLAYRNGGDLKFEDVSKKWGLDYEGMSFGSAHVDLDRDGDLDLVNVNLEEAVHVYRNDGANGASVLISLQGKKSNPRGIGARLTLEAGGQVFKQQVIPTRGYMSSQEAVTHVGLGGAKKIERLIIDWPSGHRQELKDLAVDRHHVITEPDGAPAKPYRAPKAKTLFAASKGVASFVHRENPYDDFKQDQLLLPNKMSRNGPGLAVGDIDGDGDEDFVLAGPVKQSFQVGRNDGKGNFTLSAPSPHSALEDMGLLLFDADGDGDLDLYVASGGAEYKLTKEQEAFLQDRVYLNDGKGNFTFAPVLPRVVASKSCVVAGDYDRDGDLDLFVGGRTVPGDYPATPESFLLRNDGGKFVNVADKTAPGLSQTGLVTAAVFSDADNDGWIDLLVAHEWGPVKWFRNAQGKFADMSEEAGLAKTLGWWNGLTPGDVDGDGDMDYVATNFGLNTKYHASPDHPALLYYGNFDKSGKRQIVEAEYEDKTLFPIRGRSCSSTAMPHLKDKFQTFHEFASASLDTIYGEDLSKSLRLECTHLESGVWINSGQGKLTFQPLPRIAQTSPGFGVLCQDLDGDALTDIYFVQNYNSPQVETGNMGGGVSCFLRGDGKGAFEFIWPDRSGLLVPGDAKSLVAADFNADGSPDFLIGNNSGPMQAFANATGGKFLTVALEGGKGNPTAIGARVTVQLADGKSQTAEVLGGSGYLSQSSPKLAFGLAGGKATSVKVRWPNGTAKEYKEGLDGSSVTLRP